MTSNKSPLITAGITCYNACDTIARAVDSAIGQDWPNLEVLVVDDGSSDSSVELLQKFAQCDPRIRIVSHAVNRGCAAARNTLLREARGDFVAFFDDDDVSCANRVRLQYELIRKYETITGARLVACYASGTRHYPNGYEMSLRAIGSEPVVPIGTVVADYLLTSVNAPNMFFGSGTPTCSLMARVETFATVGGFDEAMRRQEDGDFAVRLSLLGGHFIGTPEPLLNQYVSCGSEKSASNEHESLIRLLNKNREYLEGKGLYDYMMGWSEVRFHHFNRDPLKAFLALMKLGLRFPNKTFRHFAISAVRRYRHELRIGANE